MRHDTHDNPDRRHEGLLVATPNRQHPRVDTWVRSAAGQGHKIVSLGLSEAETAVDRPRTAVTAITFDDLYPPADPARLVRRSLDEGFTGLSIIIRADSVIAATSSNHHTAIEAALADLCDHHPVSVLCCYDRDGAGTAHLGMAVAHHRDGLHEEQLTLRHVDNTLHLQGEIDVTNLAVLATALRHTTPGPSNTARIDVTDASFLSAGAVQALRHHTAPFREHGGRVELHGVTPHLARVMQLLQLQPTTGLSVVPGHDQPSAE